MPAMRRRNSLFASVLLVSLLSVAFIACACASETAPAKGNAALVTLMRRAKVIDPSYNLAVTVSNEQIEITTQKKSKATESELKIQSVLLSKIAFDTIASGPQRIKIMFFDFDASGCSEVEVKRAEVLLFGEGKLSQKDLLASLEIKSTQALDETTGSSAVGAGPLQPDRLLAMARMERLKTRGTNVTAFQKLFDQVEEAAKADQKDQVSSLLTDLNRRLKDQEDVIKALAQRPQTPSLVTKSALGTPPNSSMLHSGEQTSKTAATGDIATDVGMQFFDQWSQLAEPFTLKYPPDMKETSARVRKQLSLLNAHGINCNKGFDRMREVFELFSHGRVDDARRRLNDTAEQTEAAFRRMNQQQSLPQSQR
jgi:hypothetical protein